jgi:hypothetical protein
MNRTRTRTQTSVSALGTLAVWVWAAVVSTPAWAVGDVSKLTAASGDAQITLEWVNPAANTYDGVLVLARAGASVTDQPVDGVAYLEGDSIGDSTVACVVTSTAHDCSYVGLTNGTRYHFKVFAYDSALQYSAGERTKARPHAASDLKWSFSSEASVLGAMGTIATRSVVAAGNDGLLHRMAQANGSRGNWTLPQLGTSIQSRPMVGNLNPSGAPDDTAYLSGQNGVLYRYSMDDLATLDGSRDVIAAAGCTSGLLQAGPVVLLDAYDSNSNNNDDVVIQATRCGDTNGDGTLNDNALVLLSHDLATVHNSYLGGADGLGISNGTPLALYRDTANHLIYVPLHDDGGESMVVLEVDSSPAFGLFSAITGIGDIDASPALFKKGVDPLMVVGNTTGTVYLYLAVIHSAGPGSPLLLRDSLTLADGAVKGVAVSTAIGLGGNLFDHWLVWSTDSQVHGMKVASNGMFDASTLWHFTVPNASAPIVLRNVQAAGDVKAYIGAADGKLYELNATTGAVTRSWVLEPGTVVGDPTFDYNDGVSQGITAGTTAGTIHWVPIN